jgi:AbiV family abortive infection protein
MEANSNKHEGWPSEYRGPLTPGEIPGGMNAAIRNARRLAAEAKLLLDAGRLPTAAALATLSIEETGKISILREIAVVTSPGALEKAWQQYRDHRSKNGMWILTDLVRQGARRLDDLRVVVKRDGEHTSILNSA